MKRSFTATLLVCSFAAASNLAWKAEVEKANALVDGGVLDEAESNYRSAVAKAVLPVQTGVAWQNLAHLQDRRGDMLGAEKSYLRALAAFEETDAAFRVRAAAGLSTIYIQTGRYSKAEALIRPLLNTATGVDQATLLGNLGVALMHKSRFVEAEEALRMTTQLLGTVAGSAATATRAIAIANLGGLHAVAGRRPEAAAEYRRAVEMLETIPDAAPAAMARTLSGYAHTMAEPSAAERLYVQAIEHVETRLGADHVLLGNILERYGGVLRQMNRNGEAKAVERRAAAILETTQRENLTGHTIEASALSLR